MGIAQGHGEGLVSQECLDRGDVDPRHDEMRSDRVTRIVIPEIFDPSSPAGCVEALFTSRYLSPR